MSDDAADDLAARLIKVAGSKRAATRFIAASQEREGGKSGI